MTRKVWGGWLQTDFTLSSLAVLYSWLDIKQLEEYVLLRFMEIRSPLNSYHCEEKGSMEDGLDDHLISWPLLFSIILFRPPVLRGLENSGPHTV